MGFCQKKLFNKTRNTGWLSFFGFCFFEWGIWWLVGVFNPIKTYVSQIGSSPGKGEHKKHVWNYHLGLRWILCSSHPIGKLRKAATKVDNYKRQKRSTQESRWWRSDQKDTPRGPRKTHMFPAFLGVISPIIFRDEHAFSMGCWGPRVMWCQPFLERKFEIAILKFKIRYSK